MNDTDRYPLYELIDGSLRPLKYKKSSYNKQFHHFIEKKFIKRHPELWEKIKHLQKLILMPADCNYDIDRRTRNFKKRWGVELQDVVFLKDFYYQGYYEQIQKQNNIC